MNIARQITRLTKELREQEIESARIDALLLIESVAQKSREWILAHGDYKLSTAQAKRLDNYLSKRKKRLPIAYILGSKEFYGRDFIVNHDVLIPRPESEALIDLLKDFAKDNDVNTVIDIGTGSGCLAITAKKELPDIHVTGLDISSPALKIAAKNARIHEAQIQLRQHDLSKDGLPKIAKTRPFVVMANLPYVPEDLITSPEITKEPKLALFSGSDGLDLYRSLWQSISQVKHRPIAVITESLLPQHDQLELLAKAAGYEARAKNDLGQLFLPAT